MQQELALSDYRTFIGKNGQFLKLTVLAKHFLQIALAVHYLHGNNLAHNDLKLENYLYFGQQTLKLADFGHTNLVDQNKISTQLEKNPGSSEFCNNLGILPNE
mmetsp:Transcript_55081/g.76385  ORF Transcript_55081/g.76385 Transcript_55081/m.76385 type:complete len:103 (+) Transcript_55081:132-440(+)